MLSSFSQSCPQLNSLDPLSCAYISAIFTKRTACEVPAILEMNPRLLFLAFLTLGVFGCLGFDYGISRFLARKGQGKEKTTTRETRQLIRSPRLTINPNNEHKIPGFEGGHDPNTPGESVSPTPTSAPSETMNPTTNPSVSATPGSAPGAGEFVIRKSIVGYARIGVAGISVTKGASARLAFDFTISSLQASLLASKDAPFKETLVEEELMTYDRLVKDYEGSLNIPFLEILGANLATNVTRGDMKKACSRLTKCEEKTQVAKDILNNQPKARVRLTGDIMAKGDSHIPRTYFPFIKIAQVTLSNGNDTIIVSTNPKDVAVATADGSVLQMGADSFSVDETTEN